MNPTKIVEDAFGGPTPKLPVFRRTVETNLADARTNALDQVVTLLAAGHDVPDDIAAPIIAAELQQRLAVERLELINTAADKIRANHAASARDSAEAGFAALTKELDNLFAEARDIDERLGGARTADAAIANRVSDEWARITELADTYGHLRTLQLKYTRLSLENALDAGAVAQAMNGVGLFRNSLDISPYWIARRHSVYLAAQEPRSDDPAAAAFYTWLSQSGASDDAGASWTRTWWPDNAPRVPFLLHLARVAQPWAPTPDTLTAAWEAAVATTTITKQAAQAGSNNIEGLRRYCAITGMESPLPR